MALTLILNGQPRTFETLSPGATLLELITALELKTDRIALELNGEIANRTSWQMTHVQQSDKIELVHFVGGGLA